MKKNLLKEAVPHENCESGELHHRCRKRILVRLGFSPGSGHGSNVPCVWLPAVFCKHFLHCQSPGSELRRVHHAILISVEGFKDDKRVNSSESGLGVTPLIPRKRTAMVSINDVPVLGDDFGAVVKSGTTGAHEISDSLAARLELGNADLVIAVFVAEVPSRCEEAVVNRTDSSREFAPVVLLEVENFNGLLPPRVDEPRLGRISMACHGVPVVSRSDTDQCTCELHFILT